MERVVLIGNCQIQSMTHLYKRFVSKSFDQKLTYIRSYEEINDEDRRAIEAADIIVEHVQDFLPKADIAGIATKAERIGVPVVNCGFLWPFAGQPHPHNPKPAFFDGGPYGSEASDAYLNRLIKKGVAPEAAVEEYLKLDVNKLVNLDRLCEITLEKQANRDELTGFQIADLIATHFRDEQPFLTPYHPNTRVAVSLAAQLFRKLGATSAEIARMQRAIRITPFPKEELPVHPAVADHFGLKWAPRERTYTLLSEGKFTFREFADRYVRCEWNAPLQEGIELSRAGKFSEAVALLRPALEKSPGSAAGYGALSHALNRLGDKEGAYAANQKAIACDPTHPSYRLHNGLFLQEKGDLIGAEQEIRIAAALDPFDAHYPGMLAGFLSRQGAHLEAMGVAWQGLAMSPFSANLYLELAHALDARGDLAGAEEACRQAVKWEPGHVRTWQALSEKLERRGMLSEAVDALRQALILAPDKTDLTVRLAKLLTALGRKDEADAIWQGLGESGVGDHRSIQLLLQAERFADAEALARRTLAASPKEVETWRELSIAIERQGRPDEAREQLEQALVILPKAADLLIRLADLHIHQRKLTEAEAALNRALDIQPNSGHALGQLGHVLSELGRHEEAAAARKRAVDLDPANAHRWGQYAHVLLRGGNLEGAKEAIGKSIALNPNIAHSHLDLAHILDRLGNRAGAIAAATRAIEIDDSQGRAHAFLAELLIQEQRDWGRAENAFREAIARLPDDAHLRSQYRRFMERVQKTRQDRVFASEPDSKRRVGGQGG